MNLIASEAYYDSFMTTSCTLHFSCPLRQAPPDLDIITSPSIHSTSSYTVSSTPHLFTPLPPHLLFLQLLLLYVFSGLEIEFMDGAKPELDLSFYGVGAIKPKDDLRIRYRLKASATC